MSDTMLSSITNFGPEVQGGAGTPRSHFQLSVASQVNDHLTIASAGQHHIEVAPSSDRFIVDLSLRRLHKEIEYAKVELKQLETNIVDDLFPPAVREWLFPLM